MADLVFTVDLTNHNVRLRLGREQRVYNANSGTLLICHSLCRCYVMLPLRKWFPLARNKLQSVFGFSERACKIARHRGANVCVHDLFKE